MEGQRRIEDLDFDALVNCSSYLDLKDVSNVAITSKYMKSFAYSDPVWQILFRKRWCLQKSFSVLPSAGIREAYIDRNTPVQKFKFDDPQSGEFQIGSSSSTCLLLNKDDIVLSQDSSILMKKDAFLFGSDPGVSLSNHNARITCMRMFPLYETSLFRSEKETRGDVLVTSSCDHTIRLWWKDHCQRCYRGHSSPVTTLADQLLGDKNTSGKVLASGGEDGTIRLWSLASSGKRGGHALKSTFYGHGKPITFLSVAGHKISLLVSISNDAKIRVWDPARSSLSHASGCIGTTAAPVGNSGTKSREPIGLRCHESLMYVATGSLVTAIDIRTMQYAFTCATQPQLCSFQMLPSQSLICTGGLNKAMLWDIRKSQEKPSPITEFEHIGEVEHLHIDSFKVVTGSIRSTDINVWDPNTGILLNTLKCQKSEIPNFMGGCSALAVKGSRIVIASVDEDIGLGYVFYKDYTHATRPSISSSKTVTD